jgi:hypothetical protein
MRFVDLIFSEQNCGSSLFTACIKKKKKMIVIFIDFVSLNGTVSTIDNI